MTELVDWKLAMATARTLGRTGPATSAPAAAEAVRELRELATVADAHVAEFTSMSPSMPQPPAEVVDRATWARHNVTGLSKLLDSLSEQLADGGRSLPPMSPRIAGAQTGAVLAYLSGKVMGQFEVFGTDTGRLLLVAPNIVDVERRLDVPPRDFRLWVCVHEAAHKAQFGSVDWLRGHLLSEIRLFAEGEQRGDGDGADGDRERPGLGERFGRGLSVLSDAVRGGNADTSVMDLVTTSTQRAVMQRLTALMTLLEGHADYIMDGVGQQAIGSVDELRRRFDRRRHQVSPLQRLVRRLLGMDAKLRQYTQGRSFVKAIVDESGMGGLNRVWVQPDNLPTMDEIRQPRLWLARVA